MPLYNTLTEYPPQLVEGKQELAYTLQFWLKKKGIPPPPTGNTDASPPIINDSESPSAGQTRDPVKPKAQIVLDDPLYEFLDFDQNCDEVSSIKLFQEFPYRRDPLKEVDVGLLEAYAPELTGANIEFIRQGIDSCRPELIKALNNARINAQNLPGSGEKMALKATLDSQSIDFPPTHIFAVLPNEIRAMDMVRCGKRPRVSLYPVHGLVFALHCTDLPIPRGTPTIVSESGTDSSADGREVTLPVLPLCLPYPENFQLLLNYLYSHDLEPLLANLLPPSHHANHPILKQDTEGLTLYSKYLADTYPASTLVTHILNVHGFLLNLSSLGVLDREVWTVLGIAWAVLIQALANSVGEPDVYAHFFGTDGNQFPRSTVRIWPGEEDRRESLMDGCVIA